MERNMMDVDELSEYFANTATITLYNPSPYQLYVENSALYTQERIQGNTILGEFKGIPVYIWEIKHNDYIIIDDELVLDIQHYKGNILNYVHELNISNNMSNCYIHMTVKKNGDTHYYLITKEDIAPNTELVYDVFDFVNEHEPS